MIIGISEYVYIYTLANPITEEIRYIGKTNNLNLRYGNHISDMQKNINTHKVNWIKSLHKQSAHPKMEVLDIVSIFEWQFWERYWIQQFRAWGFNLVNYSNGGEGLTFGNQTSFKKGQIPWNIGKTYNNNKKGYVMSNETKIKISKTLLGKPSLKKRKIKQFNRTMNLIKEYSSILEAKKETNIKGIANVVSGRAKTAGGFIWQ